MALSHYNVRNKQSPAWRLFHERWGIRIRRLHLVSKEEIEMYGVPVNTVDYVPDYLDEIAITYFTLVELAMFFEEGAEFELHTPKDSVDMFNVLNEHLEIAVKNHQNPMPCVKPPYEDLVILDRFAGALHRLASTYTPTGNVFTGTLGFLNKFSRRPNIVSESAKRFTGRGIEHTDYIPYESPLRLLTQPSVKPALSTRQWE